ncbi:hmp, partial [Symbiodinium sp. KB8]
DEDERNIAASPALRRLFGRVVDAVGSAAAGLQDMNKMVPALTQLGMRHVGYNLKEEYFEISEKALLLTLREGLGDLFTKEVEFAWSMVYNFIIATMLAGFRSAQAEAKAKMAEIAAREPEPTPISAPAPAAPAEPKAKIAEIAAREPEPISV